MKDKFVIKKSSAVGSLGFIPSSQFTGIQVGDLEQQYENAPYPSDDEYAALVEKTVLSLQQVV